ncbi:AbrB/MazE/SpoVT family DNA-binding domain-containing protein [bacterium]|nr:AbrB/MazE/SpoVT family DNA-binding domain-containing protein [bacterium]MCK4325469.1 AbrB/MazE/SpoVT family DNA-binding domain-containing protein [bacterium]MCK4436356.1 AbrB/MazE/SpoVT family DNA-binding domain-containing protein [bacterium]
MLAKLSTRRQFVIPKAIATILHLKPGDLLNVVRKNNSVVLTPVDIEERYDPGLVAGASKSLEKGLEEGKTFGSFKEMMKDIHRHTRRKNKHAAR